MPNIYEIWFNEIKNFIPGLILLLVQVVLGTIYIASLTFHGINSGIKIRTMKSKKMRWAGHVAQMGEIRNAYRILVGKPEGKRPLGRPRRRWVGNIKMDLRERGWTGLIWLRTDQGRALVNMVMNIWVL
jgi:hypothetical protein